MMRAVESEGLLLAVGKPPLHDITYQLASPCAACCCFDVLDDPRAGYSPAARAIEQQRPQAVSGSPRASWPARFACGLLSSSLHLGRPSTRRPAIWQW